MKLTLYLASAAASPGAMARCVFSVPEAQQDHALTPFGEGQTGQFDQLLFGNAGVQVVFVTVQGLDGRKAGLLGRRVPVAADADAFRAMQSAVRLQIGMTYPKALR